MLTRVCLLAVSLSLLIGCGGRTANPVVSYKVGDDGLSCSEIKGELAHIDAQVAKLVPQSEKTGKNVALGVAGWFLVVPWFFMDLTDTEKVEIEAYQERYRALVRLWERKGCSDETVVSTDPRNGADPTGPTPARVAMGTCFFVNEDGLAVTNFHVIAGAREVTVQDSRGISYVATISKIDPANDLAILSTQALATEFLPFAPHGTASVGDKVFTLGFALTDLLGAEAKFTDGAISSDSGLGGVANMFQMTVPIQPGNSGGPIVNEQGRVVGVATAAAAPGRFLQATGTLPQSVNWAVKGEYARMLANVAPDHGEGVSRREAIVRTRDALCRVTASR